MSFLAPIWLAVSAVVAAGVVIAHLISRSVPQRDPFPTARFVPEGAPLTVLRTRRLTDVLLLLLRLLAVGLLGLALAGAHVSRKAPARVVLADISRAVGSLREVSDSVRALGDVPMLFGFDSSARRLTLDSLSVVAANQEPKAGNGVAGPRGSLSAALISVHRALSGLQEDRESTELVIVSPLGREEIDSATADLLSLWRGPVRHVPVERDSLSARLVQPAVVHAGADDPVAAAFAGIAADSAGREGARVQRGLASPEDSAWARQGGALVIWPADLATSTLERRPSPDTAQGIAAGSDVVIGNFARTHQSRSGRILVTWLDGMAAATEAALGGGCIREVAIPVDPVGDVALRASFRAIARTLTEPCGGVTDVAPVDLASLLPPTAESRKPRAERHRAGVDNVIAPWLAIAAAALLLAEQLLRRRGAAT